MAELDLIGVPQSNFVRTTRIALTEKGVAYNLIPARPHSTEVLALNPFGRIPAMRHGDTVLFESPAIITYVDRCFPGPRLMPEDPVLAAAVVQWVSAISSAVQPAIVPYLFETFRPQTGTPDRAVIEERLPVVANHIRILDRAVAAGHLVGTAFTLADMYLLPILDYLHLAPESGAMVRASQSLVAYLESHSRRPSVAATAPPPMSELTSAA